MSEAVRDLHWAADAIATLKVAIRSVDNSPGDSVPSWYIMAKATLAKYEKDTAPLPEWLDWQYMERG